MPSPAPTPPRDHARTPPRPGLVPQPSWMVALLAAVVLAGWATAAQAGPREMVAPLTGPLTAAVAPHDLPPLSAHDRMPVPAIVPGRLVVKYRADVDQCLHCVLARGQRLAHPTGDDTLDRLHAALGVASARPLFFERHGMRGAEARAAFARRLATVRGRFPERARRSHVPAQVPDLTNVYEITIAGDLDPRAAAQELTAHPSVAYAEPVYEVHAAVLPNDPYLATSGSWGQSYADLWGLHAIGAPAAWDTSNGAGTVIAVVDTGVDPAHPDLAANLWSNPAEIPGNGIDDDGNGYVDDIGGWDFAHGDNDPYDRHGHGTHVAGTAAAVGNNAEGVVGTAWAARIMPVQGLDDDGSGFTTDLAEGILYAAENGADVINNSWGGFGLSNEIYEAIATADALGAVVVSAAGNDGYEISRLLWLPAEHPLGLTVGALDPNGALASFSNYGQGQSVAAPGVDVLSLRAAREEFPASLDVGNRYLRLSGTSMATPHTAGAVALVLAADPTLTPAEARWHVELGADQPGSPGYEGMLHNPFFGYGRLDAAGAFATPPVTTRLTPPAVPDWHVFAGANPTPPPGQPASFLFTTTDPVAWSVETPSWLVPADTAGTGASTLPLAIDPAALVPGSYPADVTLGAPTAVDGGAGFSTVVHAHRDQRVGEPIQIGDGSFGGAIGFEPATASDGIATLVAWMGWSGGGSVSFGLLDGAGTVAGPIAATTRPAITDVRATSDGHDFLLAWIDFSGHDEALAFARIRPNGELVDGTSITAYTRREKACSYLALAGAGFDGTDYWLGVVDHKYCGAGSSRLYVLQVHPDGSFSKWRRVLKLQTGLYALFTCRPGSCLFAWMDRRVELVDVDGKYIRSGYTLPVVGSSAIGGPRKVVTDMYGFTGLATDGDGFFGLSQRYFFCTPGDLCRTEVIGVRMSSTGEPLDPDALVVSNVPPGTRLYPWPGGVAFDGTDWVATYQVRAVDDSPFDDGSYVFANRVDASGTPQSPEHVGFLVDDHGRASQSLVAATASGTVVTWEDGSTDPLEDEPAYPHPAFSALRAQRLFAHEPGAGYPARSIGTIGPLATAERELLRFRVTASGLDPDTAVFSASGLPTGAAFDVATRLFQWRPDGTQAGSFQVTFTAVGETTVSETVSIAVAEQVSSLSGLVRLSDGTPVSGAVLQIKGTSDRRRAIQTDNDGRYRIEGGMTPGKPLTIKLTQPSKKSYRTAPSALRLSAVLGDQTAPDLIATPK